MNADEVERLGRSLCNWGRWGNEDERGTVNYLSPARVLAASKVVLTGEVCSLSLPFDRHGPPPAGPRRFSPLHFMMLLPDEDVRAGGVGVADDVLMLPLQASTQWDALAHVAHKGQLYGGRPSSLVTTVGASVNDVSGMSVGVAGRGVLIDVPRHQEVEFLPPGHAVEAADLDSALEAQGVEVHGGDIVLVRTGFLSWCRERGWEGYAGDSPGLGMSTLRWLHEHEIAAVATDTVAVEVKPYQVAAHASPFHAVAIVYMGLLLGEMFDLEELAAACAADRRYECLLVAPPLPVTGAVGSPVNPYAIR